MLEIPIWILVLCALFLIVVVYLVQGDDAYLAHEDNLCEDKWLMNKALCEAAWMGKAEAVKLLIKEGADINATDGLGWTPLHEAAWMGRAEVARLLIEKGADVNATDREGNIPLHRAVKRGRAEVARLLIEKGADVNATDNHGYTPLHWTVPKGKTGLHEVAGG